MAEQAITISIGAAAIISGFVCPVTPRRSVETGISSSAPQGGKGLWENWFSRKARRVSGNGISAEMPAPNAPLG